jgi:hypothetical protein
MLSTFANPPTHPFLHPSLCDAVGGAFYYLVLRMPNPCRRQAIIITLGVNATTCRRQAIYISYAYQNETDVYGSSFHGHMASIIDGNREETQGSGHLGPNFVGVASVREGRSMLPRGMHTLAHLV